MSTKSNPLPDSRNDEEEAAREEIRQHLREQADQADEAAMAEERRPNHSDTSPADDIKLLAGLGGFSSAVKFGAELEADRKKKQRR